jgi:hypothetical protein
MLLIAQEEACTKRIAADRSHIVVPCAQPAHPADRFAREITAVLAIVCRARGG